MLIHILNNKIVRKLTKNFFNLENEKIFAITKNTISFIDKRGNKKVRVYQKNRFDFSRNIGMKISGIALSAMASIPVFFGATDTTSTNNGDSDIRSGSTSGNRGTAVEFAVGHHTGASNQTMRGLIQWTLPSGTGTISKIELKLYNGVGAGTVTSVDVHELTRTFTESQVTWNIYSTGNSWTTAGGDYNASIIDSSTSNPNNTWIALVIQGTGATNPLSLDWEDTVGFILKGTPDSGDNYVDYNSKENGSNNPYLEITYSTETFTPKMMMF